MNFFFQRNPRRLAEQTGMLGIYGPEEEKIFLSRVEVAPSGTCGGGFMDQVLANSYAVGEQYQADLAYNMTCGFGGTTKPVSCGIWCISTRNAASLSHDRAQLGRGRRHERSRLQGSGDH